MPIWQLTYQCVAIVCAVTQLLRQCTPHKPPHPATKPPHNGAVYATRPFSPVPVSLIRLERPPLAVDFRRHGRRHRYERHFVAPAQVNEAARSGADAATSPRTSPTPPQSPLDTQKASCTPFYADPQPPSTPPKRRVTPADTSPPLPNAPPSSNRPPLKHFASPHRHSSSFATSTPPHNSPPLVVFTNQPAFRTTSEHFDALPRFRTNRHRRARVAGASHNCSLTSRHADASQMTPRRACSSPAEHACHFHATA